MSATQKFIEEAKRLSEAELAYIASADGEQITDCCKKFVRTMMAGDRVYLVGYAHKDPFEQSRTALPLAVAALELAVEALEIIADSLDWGKSTALRRDISDKQQVAREALASIEAMLSGGGK